MPAKKSTLPYILYSCYSHKRNEGEQFVPEHIFGFTMSGSSDLYQDGKTYTFNEGDFRFYRRNQLAKFTKRPPAGGEYRSITIAIDQETLRAISVKHNLQASKPYDGQNVLTLQPHPLFKNFIDSLTPYLDAPNEANKNITRLKVEEAVMLLLQVHPELQDLLFDFSEPGKVDLEAYMNEHYKYNVDLSRFAYLTGRSLATFKRDFDRIFHTSPNRWLQQQRLKDAYYRIKEKGHKVSDVYLDVGFKDLSHFSFAFKKAFGVAPSKVSNDPVSLNTAMAN